MSLICRKFCVFGCDRLVTFGVPLHRFPNPEKHPDLFMSWVTVIGKKLEESDPKAVYKNKRICDHHFDPIYKISGGRLKPTSIPSINLYGIQPTCTTFTYIDHCYSRPQRESLPPKPLMDVSKQCTRFNAGGTSTKKVRVKIDGKTCIAIDTHQDGETTNAAASGKDAEDIVKTEYTTEERSAIDNDFAPLSPIPEVGGLDTRFSWQQSELIPADDADPLTAAELEEQIGISLYCDDNPAPQAVAQVPETSVKEVEYRCEDCGELIDEFQFWCVQCLDCALCGACEARGQHKRHYVLRVPPHRPYKQTQVVLATIRHQLQNENMLTQLGPDDDGVKLEVKEEPPEDDGSIVDINTGTRDDPLDVDDPLRHEPAPEQSHHTTAAEEIAERPFKRPRLTDYIERNFTAQVKLTSILKPLENIRINDMDVPVEYVIEKLKTARSKPHENIRINDMDVPVEYVMEKLKTARPKPHENIRINDMDVPVEYVMEKLITARSKPHENIRINDMDVPVEYVMEKLITARSKPHENIRINDMDVPVEYVMEKLKTARPKPHENIRINDMDVPVEYVMEKLITARSKPHENIRINDMDVPVEYVMEKLITARSKPHENIRINDMDVPVEYVMEKLITARSKPHENIRINDMDVPVEYVMEKLKTARSKPHENIRINDMDVPVEYVMEKLITARSKPHENIRINDMDVPVEYVMEKLITARSKPHENIRINSDDMDGEVEYLMEELETDDETEFTEIEHLDDEFNDSVDSSFLDDVIDFKMNETDIRIVNDNETVVDYGIVGAESI